MNNLIGLDFETYGAVSLPDYGLDNYVKGVGFQPLIACTVQRVGKTTQKTVFDFVKNPFAAEELATQLKSKIIVAHNASFEQAVLESIGIQRASRHFIDSAVLSRAAGAAGKLEVAAPQLLGIDKMVEGMALIRLFSMPGKCQEAAGHRMFDPTVVTDNPDEWEKFIEYCALDAELSLLLAELLLPLWGTAKELDNTATTMDMNNQGWPVDLDLVTNMNIRYQTNVINAEEVFRRECDAAELNLNSTKQLTDWCRERGIRALSFDEQHVERLLASIRTRMANQAMSPEKYGKLLEVKRMLETKQLLGGSSLKKLTTIINQTSSDGRLRDQYLHCGAGATWRTSGRGVQMQNLKRLGGEPDDMGELWDESIEWSNDKLATNLRQVFTASHPNGQLIVGDFSSVESRGLAWYAGEDWKLEAYRRGADIYKELAARKFGKDTSQVSKSERTFGKVGELSCGYGAGAGAVQAFAEKMGVLLEDVEAVELVSDWRDACPKTVQFWHQLQDALTESVLVRNLNTVKIPFGSIMLRPTAAPHSLRMQTGLPSLNSLLIEVRLHDGSLVVRRVIHGVLPRGKEIHYFKPSERKTGDLWLDTWMDPKTKKRKPFTIWGGKLAGVLTQSLCREIFFDTLSELKTMEATNSNVTMIGQFHDEVVLDWRPGTDYDLSMAIEDLDRVMSGRAGRIPLPGFPMGAEVKSAYRYVK